MDDLQNTQKDFLTGFYTREHLISTLLKKIIDAKLHNEKFSILLVDIDHFKKINDKYGHLWGDEFLKYVASTLRLTLHDQGSIFRYGGDEFVVIFSSPDQRHAYLLAKQFNAVMANRPFLFNRKLFKITISCGLATYPDNGKGAEDLLKAADRALYFSKRYGRNTTTRASKIGLQKFKIISLVFLEVLLISLVVLYINTYVFRGFISKTLSKLPIRKLFPIGFEAETTIILKSGDVILGNIVSETNNKMIVEVNLRQGDCTIEIEKNLVQNIIYNNKKGNK